MVTNADLFAGSPTGHAMLMSPDDAKGMAIRGRGGDKLGTIDRLILDKRTGQAAFVILSSGGFLGLGQSYHPLPWSAFRYDEKQDGYVVSIDKRLLEGAPGYRPDSAPLFDQAYGQRVTEYYRRALESAV